MSNAMLGVMGPNVAENSIGSFGEATEGPGRSCIVELKGPQNLVALVYRGRVRLHGEGGATVDLWKPEEVEPGRHRVRLEVVFSEAMAERYIRNREPLPRQATCVIDEWYNREVGNPIYGNVSFSVDGWGLYDAEGRRVRHENRHFVLRDLSKIELVAEENSQ